MSEKTSQASFLFTEDGTNGPVTCLGHTFESDIERREYFREELRKKLPELKKIEGFPIADDEDIIALSDPPYYTACPNPWILLLLEELNVEEENRGQEIYNIEPYATDVTEGRSDALYNAHSYHTKVPHKAIMRYILNYTQPGDKVFDGFGGTGMTGVAANLCGNKAEIEALGYKVDDDDNIFKVEKDESGKSRWVKFSRLGRRFAVLNDLSPIAGFISYNYNSPTNIETLSQEAENIIDKVNEEYNGLYMTLAEEHQEKLDEITSSLNNSKSLSTVNNIISEYSNEMAQINYIIWSDRFICPSCNTDFVFWDEALDLKTMKFQEQFECPNCKSLLKKKGLERSWESFYDIYTGETKRRVQREPVLINYKYKKKSYNKRPDALDKIIINITQNIEIDEWVPTDNVPQGDEISRVLRMDITNANHFYTNRNLLILSRLWRESKDNKILRLAITGILVKTGSLLHNVGLKGGKINLAGALPNTMYVPSNIAERNIFDLVKNKLKDIQRAQLERIMNYNIVSSSATDEKFLQNADNLFDYIFIDPPFGSNLMYSELNWLWESWLRVRTNNKNEAIENKTQKKDLREYQNLMTKAFTSCYRLLKPGKWMTVEFSNTQAAVWNTIQTSIQEAGFIVANVAALNKGQGTYNSQTNPTSVTQDLVITAYKPKESVLEEIIKQQGTDESTWLFIEQYLEKLPIYRGEVGKPDLIIERTPRILYDKSVAYHVQNGLSMTLSSGDFQNQLAQKYAIRDGMVFLNNQALKYDKKRVSPREFSQMSLFVSDENTGIEWIRQQLLNKPQSRQDIHPNFMKEIQHIAKHELLPELDLLLEQNFLMYDGSDDVPSQIHGYLSTNYKDLRGLEKNDLRLKSKARNRWYVPDPNKQADLEKLREKSLLREFDSYQVEIEGNKKKLKQFRTEAVRTGFKKAWSEKDYETIVKIGERLPEKVLQEDDKLLMYFDNAQIRIGV